MKIKKAKISEFVSEIMDAYPNLHFIAFNDNSILAVSEKSKKAHYFYQVNEDMSFHFNLLCEIGQPYQPWFNKMIKDLHINVATKETDTDYFETLEFAS